MKTSSQLKQIGNDMIRLQYENGYTATVWGLEDFTRSRKLNHKAMEALIRGDIKTFMGWSLKDKVDVTNAINS
jgi:hypothetical protein